MIKPIKNEQQYEEFLKRIYELLQLELKPDSQESDELELRSILIKEYEHEHYPVPQPNPLEAIRFQMKQMDLSEVELNEILGSCSRKSEILSGKRKLSLSMIRKLNEKLNIPAEVLIQDY